MIHELIRKEIIRARLSLVKALIGHPKPLIFGTIGLIWLGGGIALAYSWFLAPKIFYSSALLVWVLLTPPLFAQLLMTCSRWLINIGMITIASPFARLAADLWRLCSVAIRWLGLKLPDILDLEGTNIVILLQASKFAQAEHEAKEALAQKEASVGTDSSELIPAIFVLQAACVSSGKFGEAERHLKRALRLIEGGDTLMDMFLRSNVWYKLANIYLLVFQLERAEDCFLKAISEYNALVTSFSETNAMPSVKNHVHFYLSSLGDLYIYMNRFEEADSLLSQAERKLAETGHSSTDIVILMRRGILCIKQGRLDEAEKFLNLMNRQAKKFKSGFANLRTEIIRSQALLEAAKKNFEKSEKLFKSAISLSEQNFGKEHAETAWMLYDYAEYLDSCSRINEAATIRSRAEVIKKSIQTEMSEF